MNKIKTYLILFGGVFALSTSAIWVRCGGPLRGHGVLPPCDHGGSAAPVFPVQRKLPEGGSGLKPQPVAANHGGGYVSGVSLPALV